MIGLADVSPLTPISWSPFMTPITAIVNGILSTPPNKGGPVQHLFESLTGQGWKKHGISKYCCYSIYRRRNVGNHDHNDDKYNGTNGSQEGEWEALAVNETVPVNNQALENQLSTIDRNNHGSSKVEFVVRSHYEQGRTLWGMMPILVVLGLLIVLDPGFHRISWWLIGSLFVAVYLLETGPEKEDVEVVVTFYPLLGILQLATWRNHRLMTTSPQAIPIETIQDCIVQEYVGAFKVTTHVVFRLRSTKTTTKTHVKNQNNSSTVATTASAAIENETTTIAKLVAAFPGVELTFEQCLQMKNKIQSFLDVTNNNMQHKSKQKVNKDQ